MHHLAPTSPLVWTQQPASFTSYSALSRSHGFELIPGHKGGERISEFEIRDIIKTLHPVDLEIVRELRSGQVYGNVNEAQVARLLPLFTRRKTYIEGTRLRMTEIELILRARGSQTDMEPHFWN